MGSPLPTSAPGLGSPQPHLRRDWAHPALICADWAHPCHIGTGTGPTPATSAPGVGSPLPTSAPGLGAPQPHLRRDWAHPCQPLRWNWAHPAHICAGTKWAHPCPHLRRDWAQVMGGGPLDLSAVKANDDVAAIIWCGSPSHARTHTRTHTGTCAHTHTHAQGHAPTRTQTHKPRRSPRTPRVAHRLHKHSGFAIHRAVAAAAAYSRAVRDSAFSPTVSHSPDRTVL